MMYIWERNPYLLRYYVKKYIYKINFKEEYCEFGKNVSINVPSGGKSTSYGFKQSNHYYKIENVLFKKKKIPLNKKNSYI